MFKQKNKQEENDRDQQEITVDTQQEVGHDVETIVGPSVEVEGDFSSKGSMIVQGTVAGNVKTAKDLTVETGAKILASVSAQNAKISGEITGNVKIKDTLELTETAVVIGDVQAARLIVAGGATLHGKCAMPNEHTKAVKETKPATSRARTRRTSTVEARATA